MMNGRSSEASTPVEPLGPQFDAEPALGLRICGCRGRRVFHGRDAGGKPGADLPGCPVDLQDHVMSVRGRDEPGQDALHRIRADGGLAIPLTTQLAVQRVRIAVCPWRDTKTSAELADEM